VHVPSSSAALQENALIEAFQILCEQSPVGMFLATLEGDCLYVNERACAIVGADAAELMGRGWARFLHPEDVPRMSQRWTNPPRTDPETAVEFRLVRPDGGVVWVSARTKLYVVNEGQPAGRVGVLEDITSRKRTEQELQASEERFRRLSEHAPLGIYFMDADGACRYVNQRTCEITGRHEEQLLEDGWSEGLHPDDRDRVVSQFRDCVRSRQVFDAAARFQSVEGGTVWVHSRAVPTYNEAGEVIGWVGMLMDVSEQRLAEEAVRDSEQQYRALFEANTDGLFFLTLDGQLVDANPSACAMHGYPRGEFLRLHPHEFVHRDSRHYFAEFVEKCRRGELFHCEAKDVRKDGSTFDVEVYGTQLLYQGKPHAFAIVRDITERKAKEEQVKRQEAMLAHVSRLSTLGEMTAGIAHEINQPLHTIANFANALRNALANVGGQDADMLHGWVEQIAAAAANAGAIIKRLRTFARKESPRRRPVDLGEIVAQSVNMLAFEARRHGVAVEQKLPPSGHPVLADPVQIQQVLVNLLKNAIDAFEPANDNRRILIEVEYNGDDAVVRVSDSGGGLPPEVRHAFFEPFVTTKSNGLGLGLAISRTIVEAHGGSIRADRGPLGGALFEFTLPCKGMQP